MSNDSSLEFYLDTLIIQAAFGDKDLQKQADGDTVDQLIRAIKNYVSSKINEDDKVGSIINMLAPGAVTLMLRSLGLGWLSFIVGIAMEVFHVDVNSAIQSILSKISGKITAGGKFTTDEIKNTVESAFQTDLEKEPTAEEVAQLQSRSFSIRQAKLYKIAMEEAVIEYKLTKNAGLFDLAKSGRKGTVSLLAKAIKWIFLVVLTSAGLMVAGDVVNKIVGRPNSFDGTIQNGKPVTQAPSPTTTVATQTKFPLNPSYSKKVLNSSSATWTETGNPNFSTISNLVLNWMTEVYEGTSSYKNAASNTSGFLNVVQEIVDYNSGNPSGRITYIPRMFSTKQQAVDLFIDEVAKKVSVDTIETPKQNRSVKV